VYWRFPIVEFDEEICGFQTHVFRIMAVVPNSNWLLSKNIMRVNR
jgi:hypothetical protein